MNKSTRTSIRLTESLKKQIISLAKEHNVDESKVIRKILLDFFLNDREF